MATSDTWLLGTQNVGRATEELLLSVNSHLLVANCYVAWCRAVARRWPGLSAGGETGGLLWWAVGRVLKSESECDPHGWLWGGQVSVTKVGVTVALASQD